jgi:hypothetical protein
MRRASLATVPLAVAAAALATLGAGAPPASAACASVVTYGGVDYAGAATPMAGEVGRRVGVGTVPGCRDVVVGGVALPAPPPQVVALHRVRGVVPRFAVALVRPARLMVAPEAGCPTAALACLRARSARFLAGPSLVTRPSAVAGDPVTVAVRLRGARRERLVYGVDLLLQGRRAGRWRSLWHMPLPVPGGAVPAPVPVGPPFARVSIGFGPGSAHRARLPVVAPGVYRLATLARIGTRRLWLTAPLTILPASGPSAPG